MTDSITPREQSDTSVPTIAGLMALLRADRRAKRWAEAEQHATALLEREADNAYGLLWLAEAHEKQGHTDLALAWYERALELDARQPEPVPKSIFQRLAILYSRAGRYDDSQRVCQRYTERYPESSDAWTRLSRAAGKARDAVLCLTARNQADAIRAEHEYVEKRKRARGTRLLELYEARLAELGLGADETGEREAQPAATGVSGGDLEASSNAPTAAPHDDAWLAREQALMDAIERLLQEEADERGTWF